MTNHYTIPGSPNPAINSDKPEKKHFFSSQSDTEIWESFKDGHEGAFTLIYEQNFDPLFNYGCRLNGTSDEVEDLIQELFIDIRARRKRLGSVASIKAYLFKCFRRRLIEKKKRKQHLFFTDDPLSKADFDAVIAQEPRFINDQLTRVQCDYLEKSLSRLPKRQKEAIFYYFYECFTYDEIAEVMEMGSVKAARNLVYKAVKSLRKGAANIPTWLLFPAS